MFSWLKKIRFGTLGAGTASERNYLESIGLFTPTAAGVHVNRFSALSIPPLFRAVNLISGHVGRLPVYVYKYGKNGGQDIDWYHVAYPVLKRPNPLYSLYTFKKTVTAHALLMGNGYAYISRDSYARPETLTILDPERTAYDPTRRLYVTHVSEGNNLRKLEIDPSDMIHIQNLSYDGREGYPLLELTREALGLTLAAQKYGASFFGNSASPNMVIHIPGHLKDDEAIDRFRRTFRRANQGVRNTGNPLLLEDGTSVEFVPINNEQAQFLQTREFEVATTIANLTGVPAHKLGVKVSNGYNSLESENKAFLSDSIDHWLIQWEHELNYKLLTEYQKKLDSHYFAFDRTTMNRPDAKTESDILLAELNNGGITQEQYNTIRNLPNSGEDWEKWYRIPTNVTFIQKMLEEPKVVEVPVMPEASNENAPPVEDNPPQEEEPQEEKVEDNKAEEKLSRMVESEVLRLSKRMYRAAETASKKGELGDWLKEGMYAHRSIVAETLAPAFDDGESVTDLFFSKVRDAYQELVSSTAFPEAVTIDTSDIIKRING